ncbi:MAG: T9SS type B sorting domain-containing protein [Mucilaginibacter sp.]
MRYHKIFLLILFCFFGCNSFADIFIVTSNADSGPGTLRDALTQAAANGTTVKDYINFNIADQSMAGRTIVLISQLPDLTSNLVIDGSTQTGVVFGDSDARIKVATPHNYIAFITFNGAGLNDVEFYGLYIYDYTGINVSRPDLKQRQGINIANSSNIIIGAVGKGNLIRGFNQASVDVVNSNFITLQDNVIGVGENNDFDEDEGSYVYDYTANVSFTNSNNILVGGDITQANIFFASLYVAYSLNSTGNILNIKSNNFGVYRDGKTIAWIHQEVLYVQIVTTFFDPNKINQSASASVNIENNLSGNFGNAFRISGMQGNVNFYNNYMGVSRDGTVNLDEVSHADDGTPIFIEYCPANVVIGGTDPSKQNYLAYSFQAVAGVMSDNILIRNNQFACLSQDVYSTTNTASLPMVAINAISTTGSTATINGTATPNATIEIYSSESCKYATCSIRSLLQTVTADANGNWQSGNLNYNSGIFYVSASTAQTTSLFHTFVIDKSNVVITPLRCNTVGIITGLKLTQGLSYYWIDSKGNIVSTDLNLQTSTPGNYQLVLGGGCIKSDVFQIQDDRLNIYDGSITKTNVSCGASNGSIKNLFVYDPLSKIASQTWTDGNGNVVGTVGNSLTNILAGKYTLTVKTTDGCTATYGPVNIANTTGPNINQSAMAMKSTPCGQSLGSITGIIANGSGTLNYSWKNAAGAQVGTSADLLNQPAGQYTLQVTDNTACGAVYSSTITIVETNGITMDESGVKTTITSCGLANGTVTGIQVIGATQYQWTDASNKVVANTPDLTGVLQGDYTLTASNTYGCTKVSKTYHVGQQILTSYPKYAASIVNACYGQTNGSIAITTDALVSSARWVYQGITVAKGPSINNLPSGNYQLYLTDANGCEQLYDSYTVGMGAQMLLTSGSAQINNDGCSLKTGSITGVQVTGGFAPYSYTWTDATGKIVGSSADLTNIGKGVYTIKVTDSRLCAMVTDTYNVQNQDNVIASPVVNNVQICSPGNVIIQVSNPLSSLTYKLYASASENSPIDIATNGRFTVNAKANTTYYISQVSGSCESSRTPVTVSVGISAADIPNTITPNADGINDYWNIPGIENYPQAVIHIYNRSGQQVFESRGYATAFNGSYNGKPLPYGTYYYLIDLGSSCNLLSGNLTIVR